MDSVNDLIATAGEAIRTFGEAAVFYALAFVVLASAAYAVWARRIVHGAFSLMACFSAVAGVYAMLGSDFLAVTQVVVYVGGIMILVIFGVLLTNGLPLEFRKLSRVTVVQGLAVAIPVFAALLWAAAGTAWPTAATATPAGSTRRIGELLLTDYLFPFEFASVLLLVALVGAARLARGGRS